MWYTFGVSQNRPEENTVSDQRSVFNVLVHYAGDEPFTQTFSTKDGALGFVKGELGVETLPEPWSGENGDGYGEEGVDTLEVSESPVQD